MTQGEIRQRASGADGGRPSEGAPVARKLAPGVDRGETPIAPPPLAPVPFTLAQLRAAVPAHCFQASISRSMLYIAGDFAKTAALWGVLYGMNWARDALALPALLYWPLYAVWAFYLGAVWFGVFVIGHECGHGATFPSDHLNEGMGFFLHTLLLVPYHAWRVTHGNHHQNTGSIENDEVFSPPKRAEYPNGRSWLDGVVRLFLFLSIGWVSYLLFNATGPDKHRVGRTIPPSHFEPASSLFRKRDYWWVVVSGLGVAAMAAALVQVGGVIGFHALLTYYLLPWAWFAAHLVIITWLQHTDVYLPHFKGAEWNWLRGALSTVDRSWGAHLDWTMHYITNHHVCHHIFPTMPFYNHPEATASLKPLLGKYYLYDPTPYPLALWRVTHRCWFVEPDEAISFYKAQ